MEPETTDGTKREAPRRRIALRGVSHAYGPLRVIERLDLEVAAHEVVGVVGPSGCGKSTLLELVAGLRRQQRGEIAVDRSSAVGSRLARCAYMPQRDLLFPWLNALDNAGLALRNRGLPRREARARALPLLERFGLAEFAGAHPWELSGGMRQRVAFLRTLLAGKPVLLLDEPFAALDAITRAGMQAWLARALVELPRTTLLVTHDVEEALYLCDRVVVLSARPGREITTVTSPAPRSAERAEAVTAPSFTALREAALAALREGSG